MKNRPTMRRIRLLENELAEARAKTGNTIREMELHRQRADQFGHKTLEAQNEARSMAQENSRLHARIRELMAHMLSAERRIARLAGRLDVVGPDDDIAGRHPSLAQNGEIAPEDRWLFPGNF